MTGLDRRLFVGSTLAVASIAQTQSKLPPSVADQLTRLRNSLGKGARLGVMAVDDRSGQEIAFDANSRFAMCSTFKLPLAAFVLRLADRGELRLAERLPFEPGVPLENSPVVAANLKAGSLPIETLAAAALRESDNSAANLLLRRTGGPVALTRFVRACGDTVTRCDRYELALNSNVDGDPRDTTTPAAMATLTQTLLLGGVLSLRSRTTLMKWMFTSVAKPNRLKAGFPRSWKVGHKPGTGREGAVNDVAVVQRPDGALIFVAAFISGGTAGGETRDAVQRAIAGVVAARLR